jgi:hypothetical protein
MQKKLFGIVSLDCNAADQLPVYTAVVKYLRKMGNNEAALKNSL